MLRVSRKLMVGLLAAVLTVGVSCTSSDETFGPPQESVNTPSMLITDLPIVGDLLQDLKLLSCSTQPYAVTTKTVGPAGGTIVVGTSRLIIPAGALSQTVTIKAEQIPANVNSVRFSPEGLRFAKPVSLTMSYANCSSILLGKKLVYTSELLRIQELLPSLDSRLSKTVTGPIRHFSRYAVAW